MISHVGINIMNAKALGTPPSVFFFGMNPIAGSQLPNKPLFLRAIVESLVYGVRANAEQVFAVCECQPEDFGVCGGLSNAPVYNQITANVMNMPVHLPKWKESSGTGAAICAGVGAGIFSNFEEGVSNLVHGGEIIEPDEHARKYKSLYKKWMKSFKNYI